MNKLVYPDFNLLRICNCMFHEKNQKDLEPCINEPVFTDGDGEDIPF